MGGGKRKDNVNHEEIVEKIATAVRAGVVTCKKDALALKNQLMHEVDALEEPHD